MVLNGIGTKELTRELQKEPITYKDYILYDDEISLEALDGFISTHIKEAERLEDFERQYASRPPIIFEPEKDPWKPDNRLVANFARYIVDVFNGFNTGIPVKISHDDETLNDLINSYWDREGLDDLISETWKQTSIFGKSYWNLYQDENSKTKIYLESPLNEFLIYSQDINQRPIFAVRYTNASERQGELIGETFRVPFYYGKDGKLHFDEENRTELLYGGLPVVEFVENKERQGLIQPVETLINAYNQTLSEKANDSDYFADAYMKILGAKIDDDGEFDIRDNRLINIYNRSGESQTGLDADFLSKPDGDTTQENLLNRLESLIHKLSMVTNINDEDFGNASGISLAYKVLTMSNMSVTKQRKFTSSLNEAFKLILALPTNVDSRYKNEWPNIKYTFTLNMPKNTKEEAEVARSLEGVVSQETQLNTLSIVDNPKKEIERIEDEQEAKAPRGSGYGFGPEIEME